VVSPFPSSDERGRAGTIGARRARRRDAKMTRMMEALGGSRLWSDDSTDVQIGLMIFIYEDSIVNEDKTNTAAYMIGVMEGMLSTAIDAI
jgi:hypothetical protein